jgi:Spy/CpxP family protein refolding chaperone
MNNVNKSRLLTIAVVSLLLANIGTLAFFWINRGRKHPPLEMQRPSGGGGPVLFNFLVKELALDSLQIKAYEKLRDQHREQIESYRKQVRESKDALFDLLKQPNVSDAQLQQALDEVANKEKAMEKFVFQHFQQIRTICRPDQQTKFDSVIKQALRIGQQAGGSPPQRRGPPPNKEHRPDDHMPPPDGPERMGPPPGGQDAPPEDQPKPKKG